MPRLLRDGSIVAVVLYIAAFWTDVEEIRPLTGVLMMAAIVWFGVWVFQARAGRPLTVLGLAILLASVNLVIGGFLGVVLGLAHADCSTSPRSRRRAPCDDGGRLPDPRRRRARRAADRRARHRAHDPDGAWQAYAFFGAGIALVLGILLDLQPLLGLNLLGEVRGGSARADAPAPAHRGAGWSSLGLARHGAVSILWLVPAVGVIVYLIANYIEDFDQVPVRAAGAGPLDLRRHPDERDPRAPPGRDGGPPGDLGWADQLVFWGMTRARRVRGRSDRGRPGAERSRPR